VSSQVKLAPMKKVCSYHNDRVRDGRLNQAGMRHIFILGLGYMTIPAKIKIQRLESYR
jgi:hypothetical protein